VSVLDLARNLGYKTGKGRIIARGLPPIDVAGMSQFTKRHKVVRNKPGARKKAVRAHVEKTLLTFDTFIPTLSPLQPFRQRASNIRWAVPVRRQASTRTINSFTLRICSNCEISIIQTQLAADRRRDKDLFYKGTPKIKKQRIVNLGVLLPKRGKARRRAS
jgi:hypothetical protein